jgi:hypothetical protein
MQSPYSGPPIPSPDGQQHYSAPLPTRGDWKSAPGAVRGWAYPLTWLALIFLPFGILMSALGDARSGAAEKIGLVVFFCVLWAFEFWHNRNLKAGKGVAWTTQIVLSCLGLLGFPLGTAIHAYLLSQWFKPDVKAWFSRS